LAPDCCPTPIERAEFGFFPARWLGFTCGSRCGGPGHAEGRRYSLFWTEWKRDACGDFRAGTIWTGTGETTDTVLVINGVVEAVGERVRALCGEYFHVDDVDLAGGFLMASFGDGHAHPLLGGWRRPVRRSGRACRWRRSSSPCARFARAHPYHEWIVGASYDSSPTPGGLFDARWFHAAVPDRRLCCARGTTTPSGATP
jgi:hypothetical protein